MADNISIGFNSGDTNIATDDIAGRHYQRVKVVTGGDGVNDGDVSASNPLPITTSDGPMLDAFGRIRMSQPSTLFDIKQLYDKQPLLYDEVITNNSTNATSTHSTTDAATTMHVENNDTIIRQSKMRYNYQPGKSQLVLLTGVLGSGVASTVKRIGLFDTNNGLFFELDGSTLSIVVRKNGSDTKVSQSSWNVDKLDGTGASGVTLDLSKAQIFVIDFEWLGVGRVRFGFNIDGVTYICHVANHANSVTSVYMSTPNLPIRYEISSTGGTADLDHICTSVISEGGFEPKGILRSHSTGSTHIDADAIGTSYAILGIKLKSTHLDATVIPLNVSVVSETNDDFRWGIAMNPVVSGVFTYSDITNSSCQVATGATANVIGDQGIVFTQGFASIEALSVVSEINNAIHIGSSITGSPDELVLFVTPLSANADIQAALNWREVL